MSEHRQVESEFEEGGFAWSLVARLDGLMKFEQELARVPGKPSQWRWALAFLYDLIRDTLLEILHRMRAPQEKAAASLYGRIRETYRHS